MIVHQILVVMGIIALVVMMAIFSEIYADKRKRK